MQILVCLKQTFDTEEKIVLENGRIKEEEVRFVINPYDEYAVEEALRLREVHGGEVTLITFAPARAEEALRTGMGMGADRSIIIDSDGVEADEFTVSNILATVIKDRQYDIILCGYQSTDTGAGQVAIRLAELLNITHVSAVTKLQAEGSVCLIHRDVEGNTEVIEARLPLLVTAQQGLNDPRYPSVPGLMKAKKKPMERLNVEDLQIDSADLAPQVKVKEIFLPARKEAGKILQGETPVQVSELVQLLRSEAKVI